MHWVESTQYCTVHGGKTRRREEFLMGQQPLTLNQRETRRCFAAQHQDRKASGTISTYFRGTGGAIMILNRKLSEGGGSFCDSDVHTVKRNP